MEKHTRSRMSLSRSVEDVTRNPCASGKKPWRPTDKEVEEHNVPHLPHRSWCPVCVKARGKGEAHKKVREQGEVPTVSMDYKSFGEASTEEDKITMIVVKDETTGWAQQTNGWSSECVTTLISSDIVELCSKEMESQHWFRCSPQSKRKKRTQQFVRTRQRTILVRSNSQSRATLWVLETCLIVGLLPFVIILITASLSSNTYNKASWWGNKINIV